MKCSKCDAPADIGIAKRHYEKITDKEYGYYCFVHSPAQHWSGWAYMLALHNGKIVEIKDDQPTRG